MKRNFNKLQGKSFDILVIGGGIYGAWISYIGALCGLKVAIIDKSDWASGASSASTKLIHGGLRYLEQLHIGLVKKAVTERQLLCQQAAHRVIPLRFIIPMYNQSRVNSLSLNVGLSIYHNLAGKDDCFPAPESFNSVNIKERYPFLNSTELRAGFAYGDAQTDDARFTLEIIQGAINRGVVAVNYAQAVSLCEKNGAIVGARVVDRETGQEVEVQSSVTINAGGYWLPQLLGNYTGPSLVRYSKGVHLIMPPVLNQDAVLIFARQDGRVMFLIPWYGKTLIGTTDTNYHGDIDNIAIAKEDIDYLLNEANAVLKGVNWQNSDICGAFAGLRVLQNVKGSSPSSLTREWTWKKIQDGLLVSLGGKFTTARHDAITIIDQVMKILKRKKPSLQTMNQNPFPFSPPADFQQWKETTKETCQLLGLDPETAEWAQFRYGTAVADILTLLKKHPELNQRIDDSLPFSQAEIFWAVQEEMAIHLEDILRRRIPLLILNRISEKVLLKTANQVAKLLLWNKKKRNQEIESIAKKWSFS